MQPMRQLDVRVAAQLAERGGAFHRTIAQAVELSEKIRKFNVGHDCSSEFCLSKSFRCPARAYAQNKTTRRPRTRGSRPPRPSRAAGFRSTCSNRGCRFDPAVKRAP